VTPNVVVPEHRLSELVDRGLSKAEIGEVIGVSTHVVERSLDHHGITLDNNRGCPGNSEPARAAWQADPDEIFGRGD
jgi:hypothetical protein